MDIFDKVEIKRNGYNELLSVQQSSIVLKIIKDIFNTSFGSIYDDKDISKITLHYKGRPITNSLCVQLSLKDKEIPDMIYLLKNKLKRELPDHFNKIDKPGLIFMSIFDQSIHYNSITDYNFWYTLNEDEIRYFI